jgi:hypothetical protein
VARIGLTQQQIVDAVATVLRADAAIAALVGTRIYVMRSIPGILAPAEDKETPFLEIRAGDETATRNGYCDSIWNEVQTELRFAGVASCYTDDDDSWEAQAIVNAVQTAIFSSRVLMRLVLQWETGQTPAIAISTDSKTGAKSAICIISMLATHNVRYTLGPS